MNTLQRTLRAGVAALALTSTALFTSQVIVSPLASARYGNVTATTSLNVRSGPGISNDVIGGLSSGQAAEQIGATSNGWVPISFNGDKAWVSARYVTGVGSENGQASTLSSATVWATDNVNIRTQPSLSGQVITVLQQGSSVTRTGVTSGSWWQVNYNDNTAWIYSSYLTNNKPASSSASATSTPTVVGKARATDQLMLRDIPSFSSKDLGSVDAGTIVDLTGKTSGAFTQILRSGQLYWLTSRYLVAVGNSATTIAPAVPSSIGVRYATDAVNVRAAASRTADIVATVPAGTSFKITGTVSGGYAQVIYLGAARWVYADALTITKPAAVVTPTTPAKSATPSTTSTSSVGAKVVAFAYAQLGKPYVWGATGPNSFDCSGLTQSAYASAGVSIPRVTYDQLGSLPRVSKSSLQPGDIVGFYSGGHVGIYIGNGNVIHAPHTGDVVRIAALSSMPFYAAVRPNS